MSTLQWALLLLGLGIVVALVLSSRRERRMLERSATPPAPRPTLRDWGGLDAGSERTPAVTPAPPPPAAASDHDFDEYGVSKPRKRVAPGISAPPPAAAPVAEPLPEKVIGLYIAEHEGTNILGPKIHAALQARGLRHGPKRIYHRYAGERAVYSIASLVKPGALDPAEAEGFATPGLSVFMVLPGPADPRWALQDMLDTAQALARSLNAELYDSERREPLTPERERELREQVEAWARRSGARGGA